MFVSQILFVRRGRDLPATPTPAVGKARSCCLLPPCRVNKDTHKVMGIEGQKEDHEHLSIHRKVINTQSYHRSRDIRVILKSSYTEVESSFS